jgi:hypothetical protein
MGPEHPTGDKTEITCSSKTGGLITPGGGFSGRFGRPQYQEAAVEQLLKSSTALPPAAMFNPSNRGYPDVSLMAHNYPAVVGRAGVPGEWHAPVLAGMVSLINNTRLDAGKPPLGFLNPALYQAYAADPTIFNGRRQQVHRRGQRPHVLPGRVHRAGRLGCCHGARLIRLRQAQGHPRGTVRLLLQIMLAGMAGGRHQTCARTCACTCAPLRRRTASGAIQNCELA